jgi:hypothetical protein
MSRKLAVGDIDHLPLLDIDLPMGGEPSFPFSYASHELYRQEELLCTDGAATTRTNTFKQALLAIYWILDEQPVPYVFRTANGQTRSMDAGCLGMLMRTSPPSVTFLTDGEGYIRSVSPTPNLISTFEALRDKLVERYARN